MLVKSESMEFNCYDPNNAVPLAIKEGEYDKIEHVATLPHGLLDIDEPYVGKVSIYKLLSKGEPTTTVLVDEEGSTWLLPQETPVDELLKLLNETNGIVKVEIR